ncbi:mechanosensitive ion channel protein MscS [Helicobacter valdiviensis]|uniref:Mechanosensitive ion channel protein MscS n=1 Tax=Helicobacter valdiviensis TaxID=1458358 RepID=A0A2W6NM28_9HELI|nr:mechanosensitive ion channel domain-containing protein [Helicobacter valdiviensis]PZT48466.1 mechanosensitive ion channel protein MscS [Helicobacter valdiviensis]
MEARIMLILDKMLDWLVDFLPNLISAILILIVGFYLAKILSKYLSKAVIKATKDETFGSFFKNVAFVALLILVIITALSNLGVKTTSIIAVLGTAGLAIALSLKDSLSNLAGGIILVVLRHFKKGDLINVAGIMGIVESINLFHTKLITPDNQVVILPNSSIVAAPITNIYANRTRRMDLIFGISYTSDLQKAKTILEEIFKEDAIVLQEPPTVVGVNNLGASSVDLLVRFWVKSEDYFSAKINLPQKVKLAFDKQGIEIPYNKLDININNAQSSQVLPLLKGE